MYQWLCFQLFFAQNKANDLIRVNASYGYINHDFLLVVLSRLKIWLINNASVHTFASHVTIGYNIVLFCLTLHMIKFYHSIDIIFNIFFYVQQVKNKTT